MSDVSLTSFLSRAFYSNATLACMSDVSLTGVMALSSIQIDTITCNAAVSACEKGGEWAHAPDILGNMARSSMAMATITCNADTGNNSKKVRGRGTR